MVTLSEALNLSEWKRIYCGQLRMHLNKDMQVVMSDGTHFGCGRSPLQALEDMEANFN